MTYIDEDGVALTYEDLDALPAASEIRPRLFQGSHPDHDGYQGYDLVVSCERYLRRKPLDDFDGMLVHVPFDDSNDENDVPWGSVESAAEAICHALSNDAKVLVHCTAGLNRSSLVVHQVLRGMGWNAADAVALIREKRSKWCLCNKTFERLCFEH